jgi:hypothetical protein
MSHLTAPFEILDRLDGLPRMSYEWRATATIDVTKNAIRLAVFVTALASMGLSAHAQKGEDLREAAQNPIGDLISLPFQNNTNFDIDHTSNTQNVLNIQPVYPLHLTPSWNLIIRPILPVIYQPPFLSGPELRAAEAIAGPEIGHTEFGLGDLTPELFFSPKQPIKFLVTPTDPLHFAGSR